MRSTRTGHGWAAVVVAVVLMMLAAAIAAPAQTFTSLVSFNGTAAANPEYTPLVQGTDGNLYGTTLFGGANDRGTVFEVTPSGALTTVYSFCTNTNCTDGANPVGGLVLGSDGYFYGTTEAGGMHNWGTIFRIKSPGTLVTLHSFHFRDGGVPFATLVQATDGNFYGTTFFGGTTVDRTCIEGCGTVFRITPQGELTTLHSFSGYPTDGAFPVGSMLQAEDGNLYGTTADGGANGTGELGTIFEITMVGTLTIVHNFAGYPIEGSNPFGGLIQGMNGSFYGTTNAGGSSQYGTIYEFAPGVTLTTVHSFDSTDGAEPFGNLLQTPNGSFYGTTGYGGADDSCINGGCGTIFKINAAGTLTTLHSFDSTDGATPVVGLTEATNGTLYGLTYLGGAYNSCSSGNGCGTVFSLDVGLAPSVQTVPGGGTVGTVVTILGTKLKGASSVTFNGSVATFTVESGTAIKTTVPAGATTGPVQVVTPSGTLTSNVNFQVLP